MGYANKEELIKLAQPLKKNDYELVLVTIIRSEIRELLMGN